MSDDDLPYRVELWDDKDAHVEEVIALVSDYATAKSAFDEAVKRRPGKLITLRQRRRVLADSRGKAAWSVNWQEAVPETTTRWGARLRPHGET
jgi:hypothetical protein